MSERFRVALMRVLLCFVAGILFECSGCGGGSGATQSPPPTIATVTSVSVSPQAVTLGTGQPQQFTAVVTGSGTFSPVVSWSVNGVMGGNSTAGTISPAGLYVAPGVVPVPSTVSVSATSVADATKSGTTTVSIIVTPTVTFISISPQSPSVRVGQSQQFTASVTGSGTFNPAVSWSVNGVMGGNSTVGTISPAGLYVAPGMVPIPSTVSVSATSVADATKSATVAVTVMGNPTIVSISPTQGAPGDELLVTGSNFGYLRQTVVFSGPNGLPITNSVEDGTPTVLRVLVPLEAATGPLFVQVADPNGNVSNSNSLQFVRLPDLRIRAAQTDLAAGEATTFQSVVFGDPGAQTIVWSTDQGSISSTGEYVAPGSVLTDTFVHVSACIQGTQTCDTLLLGLHPFRVGPVAPVVVLGQQLQMQSVAFGSPVAANWSQITGGGNLLPDGAYTASSSSPDGGSALLSASYQGNTEQTSVAVTGGFPGIVNRVYDYLDLRSLQIQRVTQPRSVATWGNKAYVLSAQQDVGALDKNLFYIDVYDLTDPIHPKWITAVEAANAGQLYASDGILYDIGGIPSLVMSAYDITSTSPVLIGRRMLPELTGYCFYGGILTALEPSSHPAGTAATIDEFLLGGGNIVEREISIPPALQGTAYSVAAASADQTRLYATETGTSGTASSIFAAYDLTKNPPALLGTVPLPETQLTADSFRTSLYFFTDLKMFDITKDPPVLAGSLPEAIRVFDADATRVLGLSLEHGSQNGLRLIDVSDSASPRIAASLVDFVNARQTGALFGSYVYSAEQIGGLAVYDVSVPGGQLFRSQLGNPLPGRFVALGQTANPTTLFVAGATGSFFSVGGVFIYDLQQQPPVQLGFISTSPAPSNDVALVGNTLFVGSEQSLGIFDVSQPSQPNQIGSLSVAVNSLAASGHFLFVGTTDGRLLAYDIAAPSSPALLAATSLPDRPIQMVVNGTLLLVADRTGGLLTFDVSMPSQPVLASQLAVPPAVFGVQADGSLALLAALETGLVVVDLSNPSLPQIVSETAFDSDDPFDPGFSPLKNRAAGVVVRNRIAFVGVSNFDPSSYDGNGAVYGIDYGRPQHPRLVSYALYASAIAGDITSLFTTGTNLFVSGDVVGLIQVDITNPANTINLYYPPDSLRLPFPPPPPVSSLSTGPAGRASAFRRKVGW